MAIFADCSVLVFGLAAFSYITVPLFSLAACLPFSLPCFVIVYFFFFYIIWLLYMKDHITERNRM